QMPELVERGHVYIAQPPLYKVKVGRDERYLKDETEEAQFTLHVALRNAVLIPSEGAPEITGDALEELAKQYILADSIISRLSKVRDMEALSAMAEGVSLDLTDEAAAKDSAQRLQDAIQDPANPHIVSVHARFNESTHEWQVVVNRLHQANIRASVFDPSLVKESAYLVLENAAKTFVGLIGDGAMVARGEGDRRKEQAVNDFREVIHWLRNEAERSISKQRYKGLGEMNPEQLWETTMNPENRRLLQVQIEDAIAADEIFTTLMGDDVEPRRAFIESHALQASNLDI